MYSAQRRIRADEWASAAPAFTHLSSVADISYQPEFHPTYEPAMILLREPARLNALGEHKHM